MIIVYKTYVQLFHSHSHSHYDYDYYYDYCYYYSHYKNRENFMNIENIKTNESHGLKLYLADKLNLKNPKKMWL